MNQYWNGVCSGIFYQAKCEDSLILKSNVSHIIIRIGFILFDKKYYIASMLKSETINEHMNKASLLTKLSVDCS